MNVAAEFSFAPRGEITRMTALRFRSVDGTTVLTPFEGEYRDYVRCGGIMVPARAEVAWLLREGRFPYWRGRPASLRYTRAAAPDAAPPASCVLAGTAAAAH